MDDDKAGPLPLGAEIDRLRVENASLLQKLADRDQQQAADMDMPDTTPAVGLTPRTDAAIPTWRMQLVAKLRYQAKQYANGQYARGGGKTSHWLDSVADQLEQLETENADLRQQLAEAQTDLAMREKCSYMGPMRDCPTHGVSKTLNAVNTEWEHHFFAQVKLREAAEQKYLLLSEQHARLCDQVYEEDGETLKQVAAERERDEAKAEVRLLRDWNAERNAKEMSMTKSEDNIVRLNAARASKHGDSRLWTPRDALEDLLYRIDNSEVLPTQIAIHYFVPLTAGGRQHGYCVAGITVPEHVALLAVAQYRVIEDWRDSD